MKQHTILIDTEQCTGCGLCRQDCPASNICVVNQKASVQAQDCLMCGHCVAVCPKGAVSIDGFDEPPVEMKEQPRLEPGELLLAIQARRSVRRFRAQAVPPEVIRQVTEAGRYTPSARNLQNVSYIVLQEGIGKAEAIAVSLTRKLLPFASLFMKEAKNRTIEDGFFFKKAPAVILVVSDGSFAGINGALAASNMALMAEAHGLGVLYSGFFTVAANISGRLRRELGLRHRDKVIATLVLGYPGVTYRRTAQKDSAVVRMV